MLANNGYWTSSNIIIGFPHETRNDVMESIQYVYDSALDFTSFIIAKPNAGSDMYDDFKNNEKIQDTVNEFFTNIYNSKKETTIKKCNQILNNGNCF